MSDRGSFSYHSVLSPADSAAHAAAGGAAEGAGADLITPTLNEGGGVWMDEYWDEKKGIPHAVLQVLKEVEACMYGAKTVTGLLFADEVHADDAKINPEQVRYSPLDAVTREGLRVASACLFDRATRSLETLRCAKEG